MTQLLFKAHQDAGLSCAFSSVIDLYFISSPPVDVSCIHTFCHCPLSVVNSSLLGIVTCRLSITSAFLKAFDLGTLLHDHITQSSQDHRWNKKDERCLWGGKEGVLVLILISRQVMVLHLSVGPLFSLLAAGGRWLVASIQELWQWGRQRSSSWCMLLYTWSEFSATWLHHRSISQSRHQFCSFRERQMPKRCVPLVCPYFSVYIAGWQFTSLSSLATFSELIKCKPPFRWCYRKCIANEMYHWKISHYQCRLQHSKMC